MDDAIVAARYAKHFGVSRNVVVEYFKSGLRVARLKSSYEATVYSVSGKTTITSATAVLPAGTYVFIDANGRPILEASTGNPLVGRLPLASIAIHEATGGGSLPAATTSESGDVVTKVLGAEPMEIGAVTPTVAPIASAGDGLAAIGIPSAATMTPAVDIVGSIPIGAGGHSIFALPSLTSVVPIAALIGGAAAIASGSGDSDNKTSPPVVPVPEPSSIAALALGASALALGRLRRRG
jgi:hypothetical protein